jgi:glyceraldehyde 3-phosphate dehydrogenase
MGQLRIGINGFGRVGRNVFKIAFERSDVEIVAVNDLVDIKTLAYLLKHDSNYGTYNRDVTFSNDEIIVADKHIKVLAEHNPESLPWSDLGVDLVIESTGQFTTKEEVELHIKAGAKKVLLGYHVNGNEIDDVIMGVNEDEINGSNTIIGSAGPGINSIGALMMILDSEFGVQKSLITTINNYNHNQSLVDSPSEDMRGGRSAAENIIPSTVGVTKALTKAFPQFDGKFDGLRLSVPISIVSISDVTMILGRNTTTEEINEVITRAANEPFYQGIFGVSDEPLVSRDYIGNSHSGVVDLPLTKVVDGNLAKIMVWYDNEWGYSNRLVELAIDAGRNLHN